MSDLLKDSFDFVDSWRVNSEASGGFCYILEGF